MKRITITSIIALLAIWLAACSSLGTRNGSSIGASNATPSPTPGAQEATQQVTEKQVAKKTSTPNKRSKGAKASVKYARAEDAKGSMVGETRDAIQQVGYVELQVIETQDVEQLVKPQPVEVIEQSVQPTVIVDTEDIIVRPAQPSVVVETNEIIVRPQERRIYMAAPERPECSTIYDTWGEIYAH